MSQNTIVCIAFKCVIDFFPFTIQNELCTLEENMMEFYETDNPNLRLSDLPVVGSLYAAQMNDDWLRVEVIAVDKQEVRPFSVSYLATLIWA